MFLFLSNALFLVVKEMPEAIFEIFGAEHVLKLFFSSFLYSWETQLPFKKCSRKTYETMSRILFDLFGHGNV